MDSLLLIGASVRAATFSAVRAGLRPWAIDLFADRDLAALCPTRVVSAGRYPADLADFARMAPPGPWLYTGALENAPGVVTQISRTRPLWGNDADCLRRVRDPFTLAVALRAAGLPCPAVCRIDDRPADGRWLLKPVASAGGIGTRFLTTSRNRSRRPCYVQEFIEGEPRSGLFISGPDGCRLLGVTRQLSGESWVHAPPFRYAGSIGPIDLSLAERATWERIGAAITAFAGLRGLFGVDAIVREGVPWPVEVNPRYTASVEAFEYATGIRALALHRRVFDETAPKIANGPSAPVVGKAVYYAPHRLIVQDDGPWDDVLKHPPAIDSPPAFADIPRAGQRIAAGRPVLTIFATGATVWECEWRLQKVAGELDRWLLR